MSKRQIGLAKKQRILERDDYTCQYCLENFGVEIDHVIPYSSSEDNSDSNLVAACSECNRLVHDMIFNSFQDKQKYIVEQRKNPRTKHGKKSNYNICTDCGILFSYREKGSTLFLCPRCNRTENKGVSREEEDPFY